MNEELEKTIGLNLKHLRLFHHYTQKVVASEFGVSVQTYRKIELGRKATIQAVQLGVLAIFYRVPISLFFKQGGAEAHITSVKKSTQLEEQLRDAKLRLLVLSKLNQKLREELHNRLLN